MYETKHSSCGIHRTYGSNDYGPHSRQHSSPRRRLLQLRRPCDIRIGNCTRPRIGINNRSNRSGSGGRNTGILCLCTLHNDCKSTRRSYCGIGCQSRCKFLQKIPQKRNARSLFVNAGQYFRWICYGVRIFSCRRSSSR